MPNTTVSTVAGSACAVPVSFDWSENEKFARRLTG